MPAHAFILHEPADDRLGFVERARVRERIGPLDAVASVLGTSGDAS